MNRPAVLSARNLNKSYPQGDGKLEILKNLDIDVAEGEAVCIVGASGAGKSTFLHILGTLDQPTSGTVTYRGEDLFKKSESELALFRNEKIGFVFQFHHLLSEFTALENVMMPGRISGQSVRQAKGRAEELIEFLNLTHRKNHYPSEMSGGEQQRVAIARALFRRPQILLADEPTGNLDTENSQKIQNLFFELKEKMGLTLIAVTHDHEFASRFPRVLTMEDGRWTSDKLKLFD